MSTCSEPRTVIPSESWETEEGWEAVVAGPVVKYPMAPRYALRILEAAGQLIGLGVSAEELVRRMSRQRKAMTSSILVPSKAEWEASNAPCRRCGRRDGLDAVVEDDLWAELSGRTDGGGILCLWCMDEIAAEKGLELRSVRLYFSGRALFSVPVDEFADKGWSDMQEQEEQ